MPLHVLLMHFPTVDKQRDVAATSVTNLDIHDLARAGTTYGIDGLWIVHPHPPMHRYVEKVLEHWQRGWGAAYNPTRRESLEMTRLAADMGEVAAQLEALYPGREQVWIGTSARRAANPLPWREFRRWLEDPQDRRVFCLLFGTGWGLHASVIEEMDYMLEPIMGPTPWNHLSVRAAVAIYLDRLLARDR